ncbi:MAG: hypothetical protein WC023_01565 [Rhodocyclaceae bacterium]
MTTKHTDGPWTLGDIYDSEHGGKLVDIDALAPRISHHALATVVWQMGDDAIDGKNSPQKEANARLICAAPELLEACAALVEWCDKNPPAGEALYFVQMARAAIAKATGSQP